MNNTLDKTIVLGLCAYAYYPNHMELLNQIHCAYRSLIYMVVTLIANLQSVLGSIRPALSPNSSLSGGRDSVSAKAYVSSVTGVFSIVE